MNKMKGLFKEKTTRERRKKNKNMNIESQETKQFFKSNFLFSVLRGQSNNGEHNGEV